MFSMRSLNVLQQVSRGGVWKYSRADLVRAGCGGSLSMEKNRGQTRGAGPAPSSGEDAVGERASTPSGGDSIGYSKTQLLSF